MYRFAFPLLIILANQVNCEAQSSGIPPLRLDPYIGTSSLDRRDDEPRRIFGDWYGGWQVGAALGLRRFPSWLKLEGSFVNNHFDEGRITFRHFLAGAMITSPYAGRWDPDRPLSFDDIPVRAFGHALVGMGLHESAELGKRSGFELKLGGGWDVWILRMQFNWVRTAVSGVPPNTGEISGGVVIPLCLRGDDGAVCLNLF